MIRYAFQLKHVGAHELGTDTPWIEPLRELFAEGWFLKEGFFHFYRREHGERTVVLALNADRVLWVAEKDSVPKSESEVVHGKE